MAKKICIVCRTRPADNMRVCRVCSRTHDSTTGDRLTGARKVPTTVRLDSRSR